MGKGKIFRHGAETSDEMVLEGSDGAFSGVPTVTAWWGELKVNVVGGEEVAEFLGAFVVEALELRFPAGVGEALEHVLESLNEVLGSTVAQRFDQYSIAVVVITYQ